MQSSQAQAPYAIMTPWPAQPAPWRPLDRSMQGVGQSDAAISSYAVVLSLVHTAGCITGAYHGYKRNDSVGWAIGWAILGSMFPYITIPVSLAQGFGERRR